MKSLQEMSKDELFEYKTNTEKKIARFNNLQLAKKVSL